MSCFINTLLLFFIPGIIYSQETVINLSFSQPRELKIEAGSNFTIAADETIILGNNMNIGGGTPEYSYLWQSGTADIGTTKTVSVSSAGIYTINITDSRNCSASDIIYVVNTAVLDIGENSRCKIYPNPANENLYISLEQDNQLVSFEILSLKGESILSFILVKPAQNYSLLLENLPQGMYFLHLNTKRFETFKSFLKIKETK